VRLIPAGNNTVVEICTLPRPGNFSSFSLISVWFHRRD